MISQEIIIAEKEYLVNVLGKKLIDSDEHTTRKCTYRELAKKYWPEEFINGDKKVVHHIDFNRDNNVVSNLVVLTRSEHKRIHDLFDECYKHRIVSPETRYKISLANRNHSKSRKRLQTGELNPFYGKTHTEQSKNKNAESHLGRIIMNNGIDQMFVYTPWDKDMLIFGWKYGWLKRKA